MCSASTQKPTLAQILAGTAGVGAGGGGSSTGGLTSGVTQSIGGTMRRAGGFGRTYRAMQPSTFSSANLGMTS